MIKKTTRTTNYLNKKNWLDFSQEIRELGVKNSVLDVLKYYGDLNEKTSIICIKGEEEKTRFDISVFVSGNDSKLGLGFFEIASEVKQLEITENYIATGEKLEYKNDAGEVKTRSEIVLKDREVVIYF